MLEAQTAPQSLFQRVLGFGRAREVPPWIKWPLVGLALLLPVVAARFGRAIHERAGALVAMHKVHAAEQLSSEGRPAAALRVLVDAFEKHAREPVILRALAAAVAETHPAQAKYLLEQLVALHAARPEDALLLAPALARLGDLAGAEACLATDATPAAARARGEVALILRQYEIAARFLRDAIERDPEDRRASILLGECLARDPLQPRRDEGVDRLLAELASVHAARKFEHAHQAVLALARVSGAAHSRRAAVARALEALPSRFPAARVLQAVLSDDAAVLDSVLARLRTEELEERIEAARVLQAQGMHERLTRWLTPHEAAADAGLLGIYLDSLMALAQWEEAAELAAWGDALTPASRELVLAVVLLRNKGSAADPAALLTRAMEAGEREGRWNTFLAVGRLALEHDLPGVAITAFSRIMDSPFNTETPVADFMLAARRLRWSAEDTLAALRRRESVDRGHLDLQKQIAYLLLLLGREMETADLKVQMLVERVPGDAFVQFLAAFAAHRRGDHFTSSQILGALPSRRWHPGEVAVIRHLIRATPGAAIHLSRELAPGSAMLQEEQRLSEHEEKGTMAMHSP